MENGGEQLIIFYKLIFRELCYLELAVLSPGKDRSRENGKAELLMESYRNSKKWTR